MASTAARPGRPRSTAKHDAILAAATEVFLREGYARASVDAIAAAAGAGKQTVYAHFGDKQRLFLAVVAAATVAGGIDPSDLTTLIVDTGDLRGDLEAAARRLLQAVTAPENAALHRLTIAEMTHHPELQRSFRDDGASAAIIETLAAHLAELDRRGVLTVARPTTSARQFVTLLAAEAQVRSLRGLEPLSGAELATIAADTTDLVLRAHRPD